MSFKPDLLCWLSQACCITEYVHPDRIVRAFAAGALQVRLHIGLQHENIISLHAAWQEAGNVVLVQVRD
jgi:hypothetical protein